MKFHLAQINIGKMLAPIDSPVMADFVTNLNPVNLLAESSPGFVWRLRDDSNNTTSISVFNDDFIIVNMSVWESIDSLSEFVYRSAHTDYIKRRKEWFEKMPEMYMALWYIPAGHLPTVDEAKERLYHIRERGETPFSFSFKRKFSSSEIL